ncbi:unnamed protein product, partial [Arctia plantaginis]
MFGVVVFPLFVVVALAAMDDDKLKKCNEMSSAVISCCASTHISPEMQFLPEIKECLKNPGLPLS